MTPIQYARRLKREGKRGFLGFVQQHGCQDPEAAALFDTFEEAKSFMYGQMSAALDRQIAARGSVVDLGKL